MLALAERDPETLVDYPKWDLVQALAADRGRCRTRPVSAGVRVRTCVTRTTCRPCSSGARRLQHLRRNAELLAEPPLDDAVAPRRARRERRRADGERTRERAPRVDDDDRVIVIGSGPCGATAATRLVERGIPVVMLDAGLRAPGGQLVRLAGRTVWRRKGWAEYSEHRHDPPDDDVVWVSSLSLGGLSNYWTSAIPRYAPEDFIDGARIDERFAWPVTYDELVPYYDLLEPTMGLTAGDAFRGVPDGHARYRTRLPRDWRSVAARAAAQRHGVGALPMARGGPWMVVRRGTEFSSYHCMVAPLAVLEPVLVPSDDRGLRDAAQLVVAVRPSRRRSSTSTAGQEPMSTSAVAPWSSPRERSTPR